MQNIGFIGIGLMGFPMAKNLLKSGYKLKAFNRSQDKAERLKEFGAEISKSIKDAVTNSDIIITMLTDDTAVEKVMINKDFSPKGKTSTQLKDMTNIINASKATELHLPISSLIKEMYKNLVKDGHGNTDHSSLYKEINKLKKIK
jgi:3-hydroxyisobutyrate dehydrogenase-like beta-hydroxyacid dehydrogenase